MPKDFLIILPRHYIMLSSFKMGIFFDIRQVVKRIPKGKVTSYGAIARFLGTRDNRLVGWAVYGNQDPTIPCHRVIQKNGSLSKRYSLGGFPEQKRRLLREGVTFVGENKVDLEKHFWEPS